MWNDYEKLKQKIKQIKEEAGLDLEKNFSKLKRKVILGLERLDWKRMRKLTQNEVPLLAQQLDNCVQKCEE